MLSLIINAFIMELKHGGVFLIQQILLFLPKLSQIFTHGKSPSNVQSGFVC